MTTWERVSRRGVILAAAPAVAMVLLFYSLAIHMYLALGGWPESIGERGFPPALTAHAKVAIHSFMILTWIGMFLVPLASLMCIVVPGFRRFIPYIGIYLTACFFGAGVMLLAPERFLYWWWD